MDEKTIYYDLGKSYRNTYIETDNEVDCSDAEETDLLISLGIENDDASLDIANSPLINAGVINISHKNQIESQDVLGIYPIKVDSTGHITEIGDSFSLNNVSNENDGLMFAVKEDNIQDSEISNNDLLFDATTLKYAKLPSTAFTDTNTTYEDGETGYVLKAKQDSDGNQINTTYAPLLSPEFIGDVKVPTAEAGDNSTLAANTLFVNNAIASLAPLNSPSLTGVPTAPTASKGTNTTQLATTEYVQTAIFDYAPLSNANLIGIPTAPKAVKGTNTTQIATTSFVAEAISELEGAMHYKGTVTVDSGLPTTAVNNGDTYKVAENGTYDGRQARIGDIFIAVSDGSVFAWTYVPSADDDAVTSITAGNGLTGGTITTTGTIALANSGITSGTYQGITFDNYGRATSAIDQKYGELINIKEMPSSGSFYLLGVSTTTEGKTELYNTGMRYNNGKLYVNNLEVVTGLYYEIN